MQDSRRHDLLAVLVRVSTGAVAPPAEYRFSRGEVRLVVAGLRADALVARPAEVLGTESMGSADAVDLLPGVPPHVTDPELIRAGADREPERVAQSLGDDPPGVDVVAERYTGCPAARHRCSGHPDDRAVQRGRVAGSSECPGSAARRPQPSAAARAAPTPPGGSPQGFRGLPSCPQSAKLKLAPSPAVAYSCSVGPEVPPTRSSGWDTAGATL